MLLQMLLGLLVAMPFIRLSFFSMSEPFWNWLGMGATIPARIQPGSINHVPFPTVVPCLGAPLALREKAHRRKKYFSSRPGS